MTEAQRGHVIRLLEGVNGQKEIDRKFEVIKSHYLNEKGEEDDDTTECTCPECDKTFNVKGSCGTSKCDECGGSLKESISGGQAEVDNKKKVEEVDPSPFNEYKKNVLKVLKENRF